MRTERGTVVTQEEYVKEKVGEATEVSRVDYTDPDFGPGELVKYSNGAALLFANNGNVYYTSNAKTVE